MLEQTDHLFYVFISFVFFYVFGAEPSEEFFSLVVQSESTFVYCV